MRGLCARTHPPVLTAVCKEVRSRGSAFWESGTSMTPVPSGAWSQCGAGACTSPHRSPHRAANHEPALQTNVCRVSSLGGAVGRGSGSRRMRAKRPRVCDGRTYAGRGCSVCVTDQGGGTEHSEAPVRRSRGPQGGQGADTGRGGGKGREMRRVDELDLTEPDKERG